MPEAERGIMADARSRSRPYSADVSQRSIVFDEMIGKGSYGEVWLARLDGVRVAAKQIHSIFFENEYDQDVRDHYIQELRKEWEVLRKLNHPNIVSMLTVLFPVNKSPVIVTELLDCDLEFHIKNSQAISPLDCVSLTLGIAHGLKYLHTLKPPVVHRDLATKNILLSKEKVPKIADLGVAKVFASGKDMFATAVPGTPLYAAPETYPILKGFEATSEVKYGCKVDIFSFGAVVLAMIVGHEPVVWPLSPVKDGSKISEVVRRRKDIEHMGAHVLRPLVLDCLKDKSRSRPNAASIVKQLEPLRDGMNASEETQASTSGSMAELGKPTPVGACRAIIDSGIPDVEFEKVPKQLHYDYEFQTLFIGNSGVGKSCLAQRFNNPAYDISLVVSTVGQPDIYWDQFLYDSKYVKFTVSDTAGQERFFSILPMYFRGVQGIFLVFDVTDEVTFKQLNRWIDLAKTTSGTETRAQILLVGNKMDLPDRREVAKERARNFATMNGFPYVETSAKNIDSIMDMYKKMIQMLIHAVDINDIHVQVPVEQSQTRFRVSQSTKQSKCACKKS